MVGLFFSRFWPVLIPLALYGVWLWWARRRAKKLGTSPVKFMDGPWLWAVLASLALGIASFVWLGLSE